MSQTPSSQDLLSTPLSQWTLAHIKRALTDLEQPESVYRFFEVNEYTGRALAALWTRKSNDEQEQWLTSQAGVVPPGRAILLNQVMLPALALDGK